MGIISGRKEYALGRECVLEIEGLERDGVSDVLVREFTTEVDATGFNHGLVSTVVTQRSYEIQVTVPDKTTARSLYGLRYRLRNGFNVPNVIEVSLSGGLIEFKNKRFTIHDVDADEPLDSVVSPRFTLKQWGHGSASSATEPAA